jgi:hypothetical protein
MGYTHYWGWSTHPAEIKDFENKFKRASLMAKQAVVRAKDVLIKRGENPKKLELHCCNGKDEPIFNAQEVAFNGSTKYGCEAMWINNNTNKDDYHFYDYQFCWIPQFDKGSWFTKTDRLPYGYAVAVTLRCFKKVFGKDFKYWSDGRMTPGERHGEHYDADPDWVIANEIVK